MTLEQKILFLRSFGEVFLHGMPSGKWICSLEITASVKGVSTTVRSDALGSPMQAVSDCVERLRAMVNESTTFGERIQDVIG